MTKYLITGGAGFIGSHLIDHLIAEGVKTSQLRLIVLPNESLENLPYHAELEIIRGDIRDKKVIKRAVKDVNVVYHLAARIDFDGKTYDDYKDVNVDATEYLLQVCKNESIKKFIFFSSIAVHGLPADRGDLLDISEESPIDPSNLYGRSKWDGEELVRKAHADFGLPYAIIRPASVYGPREKGPTLALYKAILSHQFFIIGSGLNKLHYVYVTDLVAAARLAELSPFPGEVYIIGGPTAPTLNEVAGEIAQSIDTSILPLKLPKSAALMLSYVFSGITAITGVKLPLFPSRVRTMTSSYYYDLTKARKKLGYKPKVSFAKGAQLTGRWYLAHQYL